MRTACLQVSRFLAAPKPRSILILFQAVAHWAIACDLHCISDPKQYVHCGEYGLLEPLVDLVHFAERVNLWWAIFLLDRRVALATGLPPVLREECRVLLFTSIYLISNLSSVHSFN